LKFDLDKKFSLPDERLLPRLRYELVSSRQIYDGQPYWIYKDPVSLRYYRFSREEHFIIEQLRNDITLGQLKELHHKRFKGEFLTNDEIGDFIRNLMVKNLLIMTQPNRDEMLFSSAKKTRRKKIFGQFTNFLFIKIPLYDPDKLFDRMIPHLRFIWTRLFFLLYLLLLAVGAILIVRRWHDFAYMFHTAFFTIYNVPILFVVLWLTKALHEFGHGLTCKNYGGEVHELGILILVFMPMLYCNITDSWTFRSKAHRLLTSSGGILTELTLAGLAAVVWYFTEPPGFTHAFAFNMVVLCSLSTVLFNANPLLRFDGYYILMDLMEVPNLRQRSSKFVRNLVVRYILGGRQTETTEEHRYSFIFPFYAVSALAYRWFIIFAITFGIYRLFEHFGLVVLGRFLVMVSISTMLILPLTLGGRMLVKQRQALGITNTRLLILLAVLIAVAAMILSCPLPQHVTLNFILEPGRMNWLRSEVAGKIDWDPAVRQGAWFDENTILVTLENPELLYQQKKIQSDIEKIKIDIARSTGRSRQNYVKLLRDRLQVLQRNQHRLNEQIANLEVRAPFAGQVLSLDREIKKMRNMHIEPGTPLLLLANTTKLTAKVLVPEKTLSRIPRSSGTNGPEAELMLYAFSKQKFTGKITSPASPQRQDDMGEFNEKIALSNKVGGEVLTEFDPKTGRERPMEAVYEVTIQLDKETIPANAKPYMSGRVQINCGSYTIFQWTCDSLRRFISPEIWL